MVAQLLSVKFVILYIFIASALFIHFRGKDRHKFFRQLTDHSTFMAPYNALMYLFSRVPTGPVIDTNLFPELAQIRGQWELIRDEGLRLNDEGYIRTASKYNDLAFNSFFRKGWSRFYLKWYGDYMPSAQQLCPKTVELLSGIPSINAAMFALLPPGSKLVRHRDPFAGSLRYHLGLSTPNSPDCKIFIDGEPHHWIDGGEILFDETYIHHAENNTQIPRLILFCDVARPMNNPVAGAINRFVTRHIVKATESQNTPTEKVGFANRLFEYLYQIRLVGKRMKRANKTLYYVVKFGLFALAAYLIFIRF